jgi:hypothetical protein
LFAHDAIEGGATRSRQFFTKLDFDYDTLNDSARGIEADQKEVGPAGREKAVVSSFEPTTMGVERYDNSLREQTALLEEPTRQKKTDDFCCVSFRGIQF